MEPNHAAFTTLFAEHYRKLVRYVWQRVSHGALAEDVAAETFAIAWRKHLEGVDISPGWLRKTARNLIGNEYQRRDRTRALFAQLANDGVAVVASVEDGSDHWDLLAALERLRPADALVLQLTYWEGLSAAEAARYLGCSVSAVWARLTRARAALRSELRERS